MPRSILIYMRAFDDLPTSERFVLTTSAKPDMELDADLVASFFEAAKRASYQYGERFTSLQIKNLF